MKFTPTSTYTLISSAIVKEISWNVYTRKISNFSGSVSGLSGWTDVSNYVDNSSFSTFNSSMEYEFGQPICDNISVIGKNINWWDANILNITEGQYIELKVTSTLHMGSLSTSDEIIVFSGFVDTNTFTYDEVEDTVTFDVFTIEQIGSLLIAENLSTQYIHYDVQGLGITGSALPNITSMYVTNSQNLDVGVHEIKYKYNNGAPSVALDNGVEVIITTPQGSSYSNAFARLTDMEKDTTTGVIIKPETQWCDIYVDNRLLLPVTDTSDTIIVINKNNLLPNQWYGVVSVSNLLRKIATLLGLDTTGISNISVPSYDDGNRISFLEIAPGIDSNVPISTLPKSCISDGTDLWVAVNNNLYKRITSTGNYELSASLGIGFGGEKLKCHKMWYNNRNKDIWLALADNSYLDDPIDGKMTHIGKFNILAGTYASASINPCRAREIQVMDVNYSGANYYYHPVYVYGTSTTCTFYEVDITTLASSQIFTKAFMGMTGNDGLLQHGLTFKRQDPITDLVDANYIFAYYSSSAAKYCYFYNTVNTSGNWETGSIVNQKVPVVYDDSSATNQIYEVGDYIEGEDKVYFWDKHAEMVKNHFLSSSVSASIKEFGLGTVTYMQNVNGSVYGSLTQENPVQSLGIQRSATYISSVGTWTDTAGGTNYAIYTGDNNDNTYITNLGSANAGDKMRIKMAALSATFTFNTFGTVQIKSRLHGISSGGVIPNETVSFTMRLFEGAVQVGADYATSIPTTDESFKEVGFSVAANLITNYNDLRIEIEITASSLYKALIISEMWVELPITQESAFATNGGLFKTSASLLSEEYSSLPSLYTTFPSYNLISTGIYSMDSWGRVFVFDKNIHWYLWNPDFGGMSLTDVWNKILSSFNLVGIINSIKKALVYKRSDNTGTPLGTGQSMTINDYDIVSIQKKTSIQKVNFVSVKNKDAETNYDGTEFGIATLNTGRRIEVQNDYVFDSVLDDLAYYFYQFFSVNRSIYTIELAGNPAFNMEPFDSVNLQISNTNIGDSGTGLIYSIEYDASGFTKLDVIL